MEPRVMQQQLLDLANAIDVGATLRPQAFGHAFSSNGSCALGAAYEATFGGNVRENYCYSALVEKFPVLEQRKYDPTIRGTLTIGGTIMDLNDEHQYTREQIAQWLRNLAASLVPAEPVVSELVAEEVTCGP